MEGEAVESEKTESEITEREIMEFDVLIVGPGLPAWQQHTGRKSRHQMRETICRFALLKKALKSARISYPAR